MKKVLARLVRQSPAMIVAMLALFVALTGTAVATTSVLITGKQIKNNSITGADIKNKSVTSKDIKGQLRGARGLPGSPGPQGPQGLQGPAGVPNPNAVNSDLLDGKDSTAFAPSGLGAGQLLTGNYAAWGGTTGFLADTVEFRAPLSAPISSANSHFIDDASAFTANCPGYGQAAAGHACVYERTHGGRIFGSIHHSEGSITGGAGKNGFWIWFNAQAGGSWSYGEWAVRAPNTAAAAASDRAQGRVVAPPGN